MNYLRRLTCYGAVFGIVFGTLLHFTYDWFGQHVVVGLFSAVNESVWEHTKLIVTPVLLFGLLEWRVVGPSGRLLVAKAIELLFGVLFITTFFYTYTGALGIEEMLAVDILSFIVAVVIGKYLSYRLLRMERPVRRPGVVLSVVVILSLFILQVWFTVAPPALPLFTEHASAGVLSGETLLERKQSAIALTYPAFKDFTASQGFAGREVRLIERGTDHYFAYLTLGSGVPVAQATCFRVDRLLRVFRIGEFPDPLDQVAGYTDVDPENCHGLRPRP